MNPLGVHSKCQYSPMSREATPAVSFRGFLHLTLLLFVGNNLRLVLENYRKYGWRTTLPGLSISSTEWSLLFQILLVVLLAYVLTFFIERSGWRPGWRCAGRTILVLGLFSWPSWIVWHRITHPGLGILIMLLIMIHACKLSSLFFTRSFLFSPTTTSSSPSPSRSNDQLGWKHLAYFCLAPTLCYQPSYPRSNHPFRKRYFFARLMELGICLVTAYFVMEQYSRPTLENSLGLMRRFDQEFTASSLLQRVELVMEALERVLKLSTTAVIIWLCGFYAFFHAFTNAMAELLSFGDRCFYFAWWNSVTLAEYWRCWNLPVHHFLKRHVYLPFRTVLGASHRVALLFTFLVSAVFHEIAVAIPFKAWTGLAFTGMLAQIPLIWLTRRFVPPSSPPISSQNPTKPRSDNKNSSRAVKARKEEEEEDFKAWQQSAGNIFFWGVFCLLGQPTLIMIYYWDWMRRYGDVQ